jgi:hypothetical protein
MAITNAQQFKQLVNPPMDGKRPGYRGDDAYGGGDSVAGGGDQGNVGGNRDAREIGARQSRTQAMARANQRAQAALGDPDPYIDKELKDRDTITSYAKNLNAARKANPALTIASLFNPMFSIPTLAKTAYQTGKARSMLGLTNAEDDDEDDDRDNGDRQPITLPPLMAQAPSIVEQEEDDYYPGGNPFENRMAYRFMNKGGIADTVVGGEFDFESARQMYGLGKLVKKVTRTVKKIAKSPIGKAAIVGGLGAYGLGALGAKSFAPSAAFNLANIGKGFAASKGFLADKLFGLQNVDTGDKVFRSGGLFDKFPGGGIGAAITAASVLPLLGIGTGDESEEEAEELLRGEGLNINEIRANPNKFLATRFMAEGGSTEKEPVAKKTMPLLDMGGKEMDLRAEGGFVPIGRMEKADDVPARLSKNEFVFTADAVRNAGEGNVDKGAEVMYNMMKNLESGGEVSEESQGLEGARKMFQTSQRLEEVL